MLVGLVVLAEFGAFEILGYQTLTTEIYNEFQVGFNQPAACALSLILVAARRAAAGGRGLGAGPWAHVAGGCRRRLARQNRRGSGAASPAGAGSLVLLVVLAIGVPVGAIVYLIVQGGTAPCRPPRCSWRRPTPSGTPSRPASWPTLAALPIALLSVRFSRRRVMALERSNMLVLAVPGLVIALSFTYVTEHFLAGSLLPDQPLAGADLRHHVLPAGRRRRCAAAVTRSPVGLEEVANSLGVRRRSVLWRVTLPLIGSGLAAAFALVFLETATELTATLVLHPRTSRRWPRSSGPTSRISRTARPHPMPVSWCSSLPCRATSSGGGSIVSPSAGAWPGARRRAPHEALVAA